MVSIPPRRLSQPFLLKSLNLLRILAAATFIDSVLQNIDVPSVVMYLQFSCHWLHQTPSFYGPFKEGTMITKFSTQYGVCHRIRGIERNVQGPLTSKLIGNLVLCPTVFQRSFIWESARNLWLFVAVIIGSNLIDAVRGYLVRMW